ncbi:hypothetical protein BH10ACI1_BH10ACI1_35220 [soil metagenome]
MQITLYKAEINSLYFTLSLKVDLWVDNKRTIRIIMPKKSLNKLILMIFAPILILTGLLGFILPDGLLSNAASYNIFHIIFGVTGLICFISKNENLIRGFNISFGLIDLYQSVASFFNWFPQTHFQWKTADDILHIIIGGVLVLIGLFGKIKK